MTGYGLDAGWTLNGEPTALGRILKLGQAEASVALRSLARRWCWRAWIEPDRRGFMVVRPGACGQVVQVAICGVLDRAIEVCRQEIDAARRRERAGRW